MATAAASNIAQAAGAQFTQAFASLWGVLEAPYVFLGLNTPMRRFGATALFTAGAVWFFKPDSLFFKGRPRPGSLIDPHSRESTPVDWFTLSFITGAGAGLFI